MVDNIHFAKIPVISEWSEPTDTFLVSKDQSALDVLPSFLKDKVLLNDIATQKNIVIEWV